MPQPMFMVRPTKTCVQALQEALQKDIEDVDNQHKQREQDNQKNNEKETVTTPTTPPTTPSLPLDRAVSPPTPVPTY